MKFRKEYSVEWSEECEADSFEEAEKILDNQAEKTAEGDTLEVYKSSEVEKLE